MQKTILAGDIGGTKTHLAIFSGTAKDHKILRRKTYKSADYRSLSAILSDFKGDSNPPHAAACFGVAGPVINGKAQVTNLPWLLNENEIAAGLYIGETSLINDLTATALGVSLLGNDAIHTLNQGTRITAAPVGIIAPGTGLGEAFLIWNQRVGYLAQASEGGHCDFAPGDDRQSGLRQYLAAKYGHVSYERICSGMGLPDIYDYLHLGGGSKNSVAAQEIKAASDPTPLIVAFGQRKVDFCPTCQAALALFTSVLGAEAGNLALKIMATGGIYLGGGIPPRIIATLKAGPFMTAFVNKGRMTEILKQIPVHVILNTDTALIGAAINAFNRSMNEK